MEAQRFLLLCTQVKCNDNKGECDLIYRQRRKAIKMGWWGALGAADTSPTHHDTFPFLRALGEEESLVAVGALNSQEAVGGVSNSRRQDFVAQHGVDH